MLKKHKTKIFLFLCLLLIFVSFIFSGCGPKEEKIKTITIWIMPNSQEPENDLNTVLAPYQEKVSDNIKIVVESLDWGSAWQKITAAATSGTGPDILQLGSTWVGMVSALQALEDLTTKAQEINGLEKFVELAAKNSGIVNSNQITAIPWIVDARAMFYRTDVFRRLGLTEKDVQDWQGFEKTLAKIKNANLKIDGIEIKPLGMTGKNDWNIVHSLSPWIWAGGGSFLNEDYTKSNLIDSNATKGIDFYISLVKKGFVPLSTLEKNSYILSSEFFNGEYAIYFDGPYALKTLTTPSARGGAADLAVAKNFSVAMYPKGPQGRFTYGGGSHLGIFKYSKNKKEAWDIVKYLTTDYNAQLSYSKLTGFMPALKEAFEDDYFKNDRNRKIFADSVKIARNYPPIPEWADLEMTAFPRRFGLMWSDVMANPQNFTYNDIERHLRLADSEVNSVLLSQ